MGEKKKRKNKRSLKRYTIKTSRKNLTSNAGLAPLHRFWQQLGGEAWIDSELGSLKAVNSVYSLGRVITILLMAMIQGAKHISHILRLAHDSGLRNLWDWIRFPVVTTVIRTLNMFGQVRRTADENRRSEPKPNPDEPEPKKAHDSRLKTQGSRLKAQGSRLKAHDSRLMTLDFRLWTLVKTKSTKSEARNSKSETDNF